MLHQIGVGVLGPVFRAYQPDPGRLVAVKQFRLDVPPESAHRFVAALEALVAADLTHLGIAAPLAAGLVDNSPYLAMDFAAAESFDVVVRDYGPAPLTEGLRIATQLGGALDFAAAVDVFHGSLHPRDVLVSVDDTRLTGLGIAHALEQIGVLPPIRRPYTAPERIAGLAWDRRADTFSLAALVYEMLFGRRIAGLGHDAAEAIPSIDGMDVHAMRALFERALAEDPAERFETALGFADALHNAVAQPVSSSAPAKSSRTRRKPASDAPRAARSTRPALPLEPDSDLPLTHAADALGPGAAPVETTEPEVARTPQGEPAPDLLMTGDVPEPPLARPNEARIDASRSHLGSVEPDRRSDGERPSAPFDDDRNDDRYGLSDDDRDRFAIDEPVEARPPVVVPGEAPAGDAVRAVDAAAVDAELPGRHPDVSVSATPPVFDDVELARAEQDRYSLVDDGLSALPETAAAIEDSVEQRVTAVAAPARSVEPPAASAPTSAPTFSSAALEESRSAIWPIALALALGLLVGFAFGYGAGTRDRGAAAPQQASTASSATGAADLPSRTAPGPQEPVAPPPPLASAPGSSAPADPPGAAPRERAVPGRAAPERTAPEGAAPPERAAADRGRLLVRSTPAGARVLIDGRDVGETPLTLGNVVFGAHVVRIAHQGYVAAERRVRIRSAQPAQSIEVELVAARPARGTPPAPAAPERSSGSLMVDSRPTGARVFVDGQLVGSTPLLLDAVGAGDHAVRLEMDGFNTWSTTTRVVGGERNRVSGSLEQR